MSPVESAVRLVTYALLIYASFLGWGILQERLTSTRYGASPTSAGHRFTSYPLLTCMHAFMSALVARIALRLQNRRPFPFFASSDYSLKMALIGVSSSSASLFGYSSLAFISYPAMVVGKTCKLIPIVIMQALVYRKWLAATKMVSVICITIGATMFSLLTDETSSTR